MAGYTQLLIMNKGGKHIMKKQRKKKAKEIICTQYKLIYCKKTDPDTWYIKCICESLQQAQKYFQVLTDVSNIYQELKIVPITIHKMI